MVLSSPPISHFLRQASGVWKGAMKPDQVAGMITVKHVYEIALIKSKDPYFENIPIQKVFQEVVVKAIKMGIKVVHRLDAKQYGEFLAKRNEEIDAETKELEELRQQRLLRAG